MCSTALQMCLQRLVLSQQAFCIKAESRDICESALYITCLKLRSEASGWGAGCGRSI